MDIWIDDIKATLPCNENEEWVPLCQNRSNGSCPENCPHKITL